ncbi:hypothetical protein [Flavonifractor phage Cormatin]|nr:hypothetical protein [Flavonifractor phage Cormatin]
MTGNMMQTTMRPFSVPFFQRRGLWPAGMPMPAR